MPRRFNLIVNFEFVFSIQCFARHLFKKKMPRRFNLIVNFGPTHRFLTVICVLNPRLKKKAARLLKATYQ